MQTTTIAAIATPLGSAGIGMVRISGPDAFAVVGAFFRSVSSKKLAEASGYSGMLGRIYDAGGDLDDAIAFLYRAPKSYTGEDVVEISCHGGVWIVKKVLQLCLQHGAVAASPGEFTKRAFLNGKMSLTQSEAVMDLISAKGESAMRAALAARDGKLSTEIDEIVERLLAFSAHLAAWCDYPEEDIEEISTDNLFSQLNSVCSRLEQLLTTFDSGRVLREGVHTAIVGRPNVGKSTLMNLLSGFERSIVTDIAGTTRDVVEDMVQLGEVTLILSDTAGYRETADPIERIGVQKSVNLIESAQLIFAVFDSSDRLSPEDLQLLEVLRGRPVIGIINKIDLVSQIDLAVLKGSLPYLVTISAKTGQGKAALVEAVEKLTGIYKFDPGAALLLSERQRQCVEQALDSLSEALTALASGMTMDAVSVMLDSALDALLSLTGKKVTDSVVETVFEHFCVGK